MSLDDVDSSQIDEAFLFFSCQHRGFEDIISGSAQPQIIGKDIRAVTVFVPVLSEQIKISEILRDCDAQTAEIEKSLDRLRTEKKALMQQLLTGQRRVVV